MCTKTKTSKRAEHKCGCKYINGTFMKVEPVVVRMHRHDDGTHYASRCLMCAKAWKVYQKRQCSCPTTSIRFERNTA